MNSRAPGEGRVRHPTLRALRHRDFRTLWLGAFLSFVGTQMQAFVQGYIVYDLTNDVGMLALVAAMGMLPVSLFGPFLGVVADLYDKRKVLIAAMMVSSAGALFLALGLTFDFLRYEHILAVALVQGFVQTIEAPTRQSIVRQVVPPEDLPAAVPTQAMTFNLARVIGPALGGVVASTMGDQACFYINSVSYFGLAFAVLVIRCDLSAVRGPAQPVLDLVLEGMRYTWRIKSMRALFLLESATSFFGIFYMMHMPAIARDHLGLDQKGLSIAMSLIGIGAFLGLGTLATISGMAQRTLIIRGAMTTMAIGLLLLSMTKNPMLAFPLFVLLGASSVLQFNSTNTLFQLLSPERLRGRVQAMHMWALTGLAPFGTLFFGFYAEKTSLELALRTGGALLLVSALVGWSLGKLLSQADQEASSRLDRGLQD